MSMTQRLANYVDAGYSGIFLVTPEEIRAEAMMLSVMAKLNEGLPKNDPKNPQFILHAWSVSKGIFNVTTGKEITAEAEPMTLLEHIEKAPPKTIFLLRDFHLFVEDKNPVIWRKLFDVLISGKANHKTIIILGCRLTLPVELEKLFVVVDMKLPDRVELRAVLDGLIKDNKLELKDVVDDAAAVVNAAAGLTGFEAEQAFALSIVETGKVSTDVVFREKCQAVRKNGLLEIIDVNTTLADIGGLENLKSWLIERKNAFSEAARKYNLPIPKGLLTVGNPGTGKSLVSKACKTVFGLPLLRLDAARLFGSLVGQSEGNWRSVHATAMAMSPCILWIDEADGAFSGSKSSGQTDGGTTSRVIKSILQDMQDNSPGIFFVLTANDIDGLPDPLLRRMDEVFNVDLPNENERVQIWSIQLTKAKRDPKNFDLPGLAKATARHSGAEIEKVVSQALYRAFGDGGREVTTDDALAILKDFKPLSETMKDAIEARDKRLAGVAKRANGNAVVEERPSRAIRSVTIKTQS